MQRSILFILLSSIFTAMLGLGIVAPLLPVYARNLGASGLWVGMMFSAFSMSRGMFTPFTGKLSDKKGRKFFITLGLLLYSLISFLYLIAHSVFSLVAVRLLHGLASAMVIPVAMAYAGEMARDGEEGEVMGTFNAAIFLGIGAGPFISGILMSSYGMGSAFLAMAGLALIAFAIALFFLPESKAYLSPHPKPLPIRELLKDNAARGVLVFRFIDAVGRGGLLAFLPIFVSSNGIGAYHMGIILSVNLFVSAIMQRPFGRLADRFNKYVIVILGSAITALLFFFMPRAETFNSLLLVSAAMGAGSALALPAATAILVKSGRKLGMGVSMGLFSSAMNMGTWISPLVLGLVMDTLGVRYIFYAAGLICLLGALTIYHFMRLAMRGA